MEALWIALAFVLGLLFRQVGLPPLVGYLVAGFVLKMLGEESGEFLEAVAHAGVLLLLFGVGLKLRLKSIVQPEVWGTGLCHLVISGGVLGIGLHVLGDLPWPTALALGTTLGFSSTVVAAKVLEQKRELRSFHGRVAIGILIVQDLVAVAMLSFSGDHSISPWAFGLLGLPLLQPLVRRLLHVSGHDELLVLFGLVLALVIGGSGFEHLGLSSELGALVLGALLAGHPKAAELSDALWGLKEALLVGFFLQIGLAGLPSLEAVGVAIGLALLLPLKMALFFFVLIRFKLRARSSFLTGLALMSYSEFALIVAGFSVSNGTLSPDWLVLLAITIALSFAIAAPFNRVAHQLYERFESRLLEHELPERHPDEQPISLGNSHVLILGMGEIGTAAYDFFCQRQERVAGLDSDPGKVETHLQAGRRVLYGDAEDPGFWHTLKLGGIKAVILTAPETEVAVITATQLRRRGYRGLIGAIGTFSDEAQAVLDAGADKVFMAQEEAGVGLAGHVWEALDEKRKRTTST